MENSRNCRKKNVRFYCQLPTANCQLPTAYRGTGLLVLFIILSIVSQIFVFQAEEIEQPDYAAAVKTFDEYVKKRLKIDQIPGYGGCGQMLFETEQPEKDHIIPGVEQ